MSLDSSLKHKNALVRHRNVLTRAERLEKLADEERWTEEQSVFGLPKVEHRKAVAKSKPGKEAAECAEGAAGEAAAPAAEAEE